MNAFEVRILALTEQCGYQQYQPTNKVIDAIMHTHFTFAVIADDMIFLIATDINSDRLSYSDLVPLINDLVALNTLPRMRYRFQGVLITDAFIDHETKKICCRQDLNVKTIDQAELLFRLLPNLRPALRLLQRLKCRESSDAIKAAAGGLRIQGRMKEAAELHIYAFGEFFARNDLGEAKEHALAAAMLLAEKQEFDKAAEFLSLAAEKYRQKRNELASYELLSRCADSFRRAHFHILDRNLEAASRNLEEVSDELRNHDHIAKLSLIRENLKRHMQA
jgi:hypothetical protein